MKFPILCNLCNTDEARFGTFRGSVRLEPGGDLGWERLGVCTLCGEEPGGEPLRTHMQQLHGQVEVVPTLRILLHSPPHLRQTLYFIYFPPCSPGQRRVTVEFEVLQQLNQTIPSPDFPLSSPLWVPSLVPWFPGDASTISLVFGR